MIEHPPTPPTDLPEPSPTNVDGEKSGSTDLIGTLKNAAASARRGVLSDVRVMRNTEAVEEVRAAIDDAEAEAVRALTLLDAGRSIDEVVQEGNLSRARVVQLLDGRLPAAIRKRTEESRDAAMLPCVFPVRGSPGFSYLLGVYCGFTHVGTAHEQLEWTIPEGAVAREVARGARESTGEDGVTVARRTKSPHSDVYWYVRINRKAVGEYVGRVTSRNTHLPWVHLGSDEEQRAFLRGVLDATGCVNGEYFEVSKKHGGAWIRDLVVLLSKQGVYPWYQLKPIPILRIGARPDLARLIEVAPLTDHSRRTALQALCNRKPDRFDPTPSQFDRAQELARTSTLRDADIARSVGAPIRMVAGWLRREIVPTRVKRRDAARALEELLPLRAEAEFFMRTVGVTVPASERVAGEIRENDFVSAVDLIARAGRPVEPLLLRARAVPDADRSEPASTLSLLAQQLEGCCEPWPLAEAVLSGLNRGEVHATPLTMKLALLGIIESRDVRERVGSMLW